MIADNDDDAYDESQIQEEGSNLKVKWYLIYKKSAFCKFWDFIITLTLEYSLFLTPFLIVFPCIYTCTIDASCAPIDDGTESGCAGATLQNIEMAIDIIWSLEIVLNFVKVSR